MWAREKQNSPRKTTVNVAGFFPSELWWVQLLLSFFIPMPELSHYLIMHTIYCILWSLSFIHERQSCFSVVGRGWPWSWILNEAFFNIIFKIYAGKITQQQYNTVQYNTKQRNPMLEMCHPLKYSIRKYVYAPKRIPWKFRI